MLGGVIFDKDGTLFDFDQSWSLWAAQLLEDLSCGDEGQAARLAGVIDFDRATQRFAPTSLVIAGTPVEIATELLVHLDGWTHPALVDHLNTLASAAPQAQIVPLRSFLSQLRDGGLKLGLVTNDGEAPALAHLRQAGIEDLFDFIAGCDSGYGAKPAPGGLQAFCEHCNLMPARVAMVGDSLHDLHAGQAAGMLRVGVLTGLATHADLTPHADVVLPDIGALPAWIAATTR